MRHTALIRICSLIALGLFSMATHAGDVRQIALQTEQLPEASGLVASIRSPGRLWTHNDGGYGAEIYAVDPQGRVIVELKIAGAGNRDWEDIAAFSEGGRAQLLIADVGDNSSVREYLTLYVVDEPELPSEDSVPLRLSSETVRKIEFRLPDGAADIEGVAVDGPRGEIILITKRDATPRVYSLPLYPSSDEADLPEATLITGIETLPAPDLDDLKANLTMAPFLRQPTALDYDAATDSYLITTYADAHIYRRKAGESLVTMFRRTPETVQLPLLKQMEGGCFCDGESLCFISEKLPTIMLVADRPAPAAAR